MEFNYKINPITLMDGIDVLEESIFQLDKRLLSILLFDRTTRKNILWATKDYESLGNGFEEHSEITPACITGAHATLIQPRITKTLNIQSGRTKERAEVFTPSWVCNQQNNLVDNQWFKRTDVFNVEHKNGWTATTCKVDFSNSQKTWKQYVDSNRLEVCCGEAPYLVSRYDTVTGERIPIEQRIGLLDRKLRIVNENVNDAEWLNWTTRAFQSVYGYEFQGDNLLLARENLFYTFIDYYYYRFEDMPSLEVMEQFAHIISWNLWQMDGLNYVVPYSCHAVRVEQMSFFDMDTTTEPCPGCAKQQHHLHNGQYAKIHNWRSKVTNPFFLIVKGSEAT